MQTGVKRALSVVAILAIALHAMVWAAIPFAAAQAAAADPFSIICHSEGGTGGQTGDLPGQPPTKVCDHCNLSAFSKADAPPEGVLAGHLAPARVLHWLEPAVAAVRLDAAVAQKLPRGPPHRT